MPKTILVVEDEEGIRVVLDKALQKSGYNVLVASQADEALLVCEQHDGPIHLIVTDMLLPRIDGHDLAEQVKACHPEAKVLYISGYPDETVARLGMVISKEEFLQKPFSLATLVSKARELLEK